jgi:TolA-binding protein
MNLTIDQIKQLGDLEDKIKELSSNKKALQAKIVAQSQDDESRLNTVYSSTYNQELTQKSQELAASKIQDLINWEIDSSTKILDLAKRTYFQFLTSIDLVSLLEKFASRYGVSLQSAKIYISKDLENSMQIPNSQVDAGLAESSFIVDFADIKLDLSFESVKEDLVPLLASESLSLNLN